jgi:magnesium chelatase family protein
MLGSPGTGKSSLARRLTTILPAMPLAEAVETTRIHRVAGLTGARTAVITMRPCCALTTPPRMWGGSVGVSAAAR